MRKLLANKWKTPDGVILWSKYTHDCQSHIDKEGRLFMVYAFMTMVNLVHIEKLFCGAKE